MPKSQTQGLLCGYSPSTFGFQVYFSVVTVRVDRGITVSWAIHIFVKISRDETC